MIEARDYFYFIGEKMAKKRKSEVITVNDQIYDLTVMRIETRRPNGEPETVTLISSTDTAELSTDVKKNCFILGYIPKLNYKQHAGELCDFEND